MRNIRLPVFELENSSSGAELLEYINSLRNGQYFDMKVVFDSGNKKPLILWGFSPEELRKYILDNLTGNSGKGYLCIVYSRKDRIENGAKSM